MTEEQQKAALAESDAKYDTDTTTKNKNKSTNSNNSNNQASDRPMTPSALARASLESGAYDGYTLPPHLLPQQQLRKTQQQHESTYSVLMSNKLGISLLPEDLDSIEIDSVQSDGNTGDVVDAAFLAAMDPSDDDASTAASQLDNNTTNNTNNTNSKNNSSSSNNVKADHASKFEGAGPGGRAMGEGEGGKKEKRRKRRAKQAAKKVRASKFQRRLSWECGG
jgi:hypothetical protein